VQRFSLESSVESSNLTILTAISMVRVFRRTGLDCDRVHTFRYLTIVVWTDNIQGPRTR
jgi:hypothetical protein